MLFDQAGSYTNDTTISDGADIGAAGVTLTNSSSGRIVGGVRFLVGGSTVINELGGIVRVADGADLYTTLAVTGSTSNDIFTNKGLLNGLVQLGDGNDLFVRASTSTGIHQIDLGAGNDTLQWSVPLGSTSFAAAEGGTGFDRLEFRQTSQALVYNGGVNGFEELLLSGSGQYSGFSGFASIVLGTPLEYGLGLIDSFNPLADVALAGNSLRLFNSTLKSIAGTSAAETVELGDGAGVSGGIALGGGNDVLWLTRFGAGPNPALPGGGAQGGDGNDTLYFLSSQTGSMTYDLASATGFERLDLNSQYVIAVDFDVANADGFARITLGQNASLVLRASHAPEALLRGGFGGAILLDASTTIGRYGFPVGEGFITDTNLVQGDDTLSVDFTNQGQVLGDIAFYIGDDTYDGSAGSVGGTVFGNAGNDTLTGGAGAEHFEGGYGADRLTGGLGNDTLDGGGNIDTAVFSGNSGAYAWSVADTWNPLEAETHVLGPDGADTLAHVERMQFADATYEYRPTGTFDAPVLLTGTFGASAGAGRWDDNSTYPRTIGDIDGDGLADLVGFGSSGVYVSLGDADGQFAQPVLMTTAFGTSSASGSWSDYRTYPRMVGDVNGDGADDLIGFGDAGVLVALSYGPGGFFKPVTLGIAGFGAGASAGGWSDNRTYPRLVADVNGDGLDDLVGFGDGGVHVALAAGNGNFGAAFLATSGFGAGAAAGGWSDDDVYSRTLADMNGDGRADIVGFGSAGVYVAFGREDGTFVDPFFAFAGFGAETGAGGWASNELYYRTVGDMDGDGNADLVGFGDGGVHVAWGDGDGGFEAGGLLLNNFGVSAAAGGWTSQDLYPRLLADLNGDGAADIVGFGDSGVIAAASVTDWVLV